MNEKDETLFWLKHCTDKCLESACDFTMMFDSEMFRRVADYAKTHGYPTVFAVECNGNCYIAFSEYGKENIIATLNLEKDMLQMRVDEIKRVIAEVNSGG